MGVGWRKVSLKLTVTRLEFLSQGGETVPWELVLMQRSIALFSFPDSICRPGAWSGEGELAGPALGWRWHRALLHILSTPQQLSEVFLLCLN